MAGVGACAAGGEVVLSERNSTSSLILCISTLLLSVICKT